MIKYIFMIKRKHSVSAQEFRKHWQAPDFQEMVREIGRLLGARDFYMSLVLDVDFNKQLNASRGVEDAPFDAVMEYLLPSAKHLESVLESEEFKTTFAKLEALEAEFIDFEHSQRCFTEHSDPIIT